MSLVELKQMAKDHNPPIKYYYIKSRVDLIQILTMSEFTQDMITEKYTIHQLRKQAREKGYLNVWKMKRAELMGLLYPSTKKEDKNDDDTKEHNNPEEREGKEVGVEV